MPTLGDILQSQLDAKLDKNSLITGATHTKLTYDAKGLITSATDATTADIAPSTNRNYVTDAQLVVIGNTSGTNTGDQTSVTGNAGTATLLQTARNINGVSFNGGADITVTAAAGTLTGTTLNATVVTSSLTAVGVLVNLTVTNPITGSVTGNAATSTAFQTARTIDGVSFDATANILVVAPATHAATNKATPVDADELPLANSASSYVLNHVTWANVKATLKTYNDTLYQPLNSNLTTIAGLTATTNNFMVAQSSAWASVTPTTVTSLLNNFVGDSGSGGTKGLVPAPAAGDAAALKFLKADGTWTTPGGGGTVTSVTSANSDATVATTTSTPVITIVSAPKLTTARTIGGVSFDGTAAITVATATGGFTVSGGALAVGANDITCTGSLGATASRLTKGWFTDLQVTNAIAGSITGNAATTTTNANMTGDVTSIGNATTIGANKVTLGMLATLAANSVIGNTTAGPLTPVAVSMLTTATASAILLRDANANALANNFLNGYTTTATAAGTTTLVVGSTRQQFFTGSTTQTVTLPVTSTLALGHQFYIRNDSSGVVTVNSSGANAVQAMAASTAAIFTCILTSGTSAASWSVTYVAAGGSGTVTSVTSANSDATVATTTTTPVITIVSAPKLTTTRAIYGNNFDGSAALTQIIASTYGGTGNGFAKFSGPTTSEKTFTLPNSSETLLYSGGALGTPSSGTLTNCTGLPIAGLTASTSTALGVGSIELGAASDTTIARVSAGVISVEGVTVPTISSTNTFTNKRVTKRTGTTTSSATPTINTDNVDFYSLTAQTTDITSFTTNLTGAPTEAQTLWIAITGTASRGITWGTSFEASTVALPVTTSSTNRLDVGFVWNTVTNKWRCVAAV